MPLPTSIHTSVGPSILSKASRLFAGTIGDGLSEALQNSRRAGATRVDIDQFNTGRGPVLRIRDNGSGIADPSRLLALGDSGWPSDLAEREDPAGMGMFSLSGRRVTVRSHPGYPHESWQVTITPEAWESGEPLPVLPCDIERGAEIEIDMPEAWAVTLADAVKAAATYYPLPVYFQGEALPRKGFLAGAKRIEDWNGCRIGIFDDERSSFGDKPRINFHGLTVPCRLPSVSDEGCQWQVRVEIVEAPQIQLVLPARKEAVENAALSSLREACEAAIYRTIAHKGHHRLAHAQWLRAGELGVALPEAEPWLWAWTPCTAEWNSVRSGERIAGEAMILMPEDDAHIEQCLARALASGRPMGAVPVEAERKFIGYSWYNALPQVLGFSFRIEPETGEVFDYSAQIRTPEGLVSQRVKAISLELHVQASGDPDTATGMLTLPADALVIPDDCWSNLEDVVILLTKDSTITPGDLATLLIDACFCPNDGSNADSHETQRTAFEMQARFTANLLLLGEDAAIIQRVQEAVREHVSWLLPDNRAVTIHAAGHSVEAAFADNDDVPALTAAE
jgi:hypothetical protein